MYIGRFAPSPTGPLHFGSLIAAVASYLESRSQNGLWLVRMDDLDPPREKAGAASTILQSLDAFGFEWDGEVMYQSQRHSAYAAALEQLEMQGKLYPCSCSRKDIAKQGITGPYGPIYPGNCRALANRDPNKPAVLRLRTHDDPIRFLDGIQGEYSQRIESEIGDFLLKRRDELYAYHLAVVVDDAEQNISDIVRGVDLLDSTPRQIYIQQLLQLPTPRYSHLPLAVNAQRQKLSKQSYAKAIDARQATKLLCDALSFLGQSPEQGLETEALNSVWTWAISHWQISKVPRLEKLEIERSNYL